VGCEDVNLAVGEKVKIWALAGKFWAKGIFVIGINKLLGFCYGVFFLSGCLKDAI
jgi:hypothetical protein